MNKKWRYTAAFALVTVAFVAVEVVDNLRSEPQSGKSPLLIDDTRTPDQIEANAAYEQAMAEFLADDGGGDDDEFYGGPEDVNGSIVTWNVESDGNDPELIAEQLGDFWDDGVVCLSEVRPESVELYKQAFQGSPAMVSRPGYSDRLMIVPSVRFQVLEQNEHDVIKECRHRSALSMLLKDRITGTQFIVLTVHLARGDAEFRTEQSRRLVEWARNETDPIIAIGDFNMDYTFATEQGNDAFTEIMRDGEFKWLKPEPLIDSQWSDDGQGGDRYPGSILDLAFAANAAAEWDIESTVIVREGDFPDDDRTSDYWAIRVTAGTGDDNE